MAIHIRRREFIFTLGGAAAAWPLAARAQQPERMRRIGVLVTLAEDDPESVARRGAFEQALQASGWTVGRNIRVEYRWGAFDPARTQKLAAELAALAPDVIVVSSNYVLAPMLQAAPTTPIVFTQVIDPLGSGFVESMARPGGNVTGFTQFEYSLAGKWLESEPARVHRAHRRRRGRVAELADPGPAQEGAKATKEMKQKEPRDTQMNILSI
jgi:putative tryptophan/tyrosine transport system substrate-binding protein